MRFQTFPEVVIIRCLIIGLILICSCSSRRQLDKPALSLVEPITKQFSLDDILEAEYAVTVKNERGKKEQMQFEWPWYVAIGGKIMNETAVFERAAAGQIDQSMVLGMATRKYFLWSAHRAKAIRVANRDTTDWNEIRKILMEVAGEGTILSGITPLPPEVIQSQVLRQNIPPELFITGGLTEVTVAEESVAAGLTFAGIGASGKVVQTSVTGTLEITDPYTGELVVSVMAQNRVTAEQIGAEGFRIVSFGGDQEYLNVELSTAREMIKQQVQVELVDYLFYMAFKELIEEKTGYLTNRLHYRVGRIQGYAQELATKRGLTVLDNVVPVFMGASLEISQPVIGQIGPKAEVKEKSKLSTNHSKRIIEESKPGNTKKQRSKAVPDENSKSYPKKEGASKSKNTSESKSQATKAKEKDKTVSEHSKEVISKPKSEKADETKSETTPAKKSEAGSAKEGKSELKTASTNKSKSKPATEKNTKSVSEQEIKSKPEATSKSKSQTAPKAEAKKKPKPSTDHPEEVVEKSKPENVEKQKSKVSPDDNSKMEPKKEGTSKPKDTSESKSQTTRKTEVKDKSNPSTTSKTKSKANKKAVAKGKSGPKDDNHQEKVAEKQKTGGAG